MGKLPSRVDTVVEYVIQRRNKDGLSSHYKADEREGYEGKILVYTWVDIQWARIPKTRVEIENVIQKLDDFYFDTNVEGGGEKKDEPASLFNSWWICAVPGAAYSPGHVNEPEHREVNAIHAKCFLEA